MAQLHSLVSRLSSNAYLRIAIYGEYSSKIPCRGVLRDEKLIDRQCASHTDFLKSGASGEMLKEKRHVGLASTFWPNFGSDQNGFATSRVGFQWLVKSSAEHKVEWSIRRNALPSAQKYRPLRDGMIRLLRIRPGLAISTIECDLLYVPLNSAGEYAALSYTWGQIAPSVPIMVNGSVTLVSENLYLALLHFRKSEVTKLWVDAICINQNDTAERTSQVGQMKDVYQKAEIVFVWLGESNEHSEQAFDDLYSLAGIRNLEGTVPSQQFDKEMMDRDYQSWRAIGDILCRPWFRRVWIIQEVLSARRAIVVCGGDTMDLDLFLKLINSMIKSRALPRIMSYCISRHGLSKRQMQSTLQQLKFLVEAKFHEIDFYTGHKFKPTLLNYLAETRGAEATDPRDKAYALINLISDSRSLGHWCTAREGNRTWVPFKPDYSLSKAEVFINTTKAILCTTGSLDVLQFAKHKSNKANKLPSWVPDWSTEEHQTALDHFSLQPTLEEPSRDWRPKLSNSGTERDPTSYEITLFCRPSFSLGSGNTLSIKGFHFDTITAVSRHTYPVIDTTDAFNPESEDAVKFALIEQYLESTLQLVKECLHHIAQSTSYPISQDIWSSLWRILNGNATQHDDRAPETCEVLLESILKVQSIFATHKKLELSNQFEDSGPLTKFALEACFSNMKYYLDQLPVLDQEFSSWRFTVTRDKHLGLVPNEARVGDIICVMHGCEIPFLLRSRGRERYELVGHCKVDGFNFDDAVVESRVLLSKRNRWKEKDYDFSIIDETKRRVYVTLKKTREFTLV
jgi:hypothetical protein